jgi:glycosyltransferase A (GT-A) superfamily protein (DUF2064 family)
MLFEIGTMLFQFLAFIIFLSMIGGFIYIIWRLLQIPMSMEEIMKKLDYIQQNMATKKDLEGLATIDHVEDVHEDVLNVAETKSLPKK